MKKIFTSVVASLILAGSLFANDVKPTCQDKEELWGGVLMGALQGAIIGGPVGAFWFVGIAGLSEEVSKKPCPTNAEMSNQITDAVSILKEAIDSEEVNVVNIAKVTEEEVDLIKKGEKHISTDLIGFATFGFDSSDLNDGKLDLSQLNSDDISYVLIEGHTDKKGTKSYNEKLGMKRAQAVKQFLISKNIKEDKLFTVSHGEVLPISKNDSDNRRVDLKVFFK